MIKTKKENALDKALRYLYASLVYLEVPLMAIRFKFNDEEWEADTVKEAVALRAKLEYATHFQPDPHREVDKQDRYWTPDRFIDVINGIGRRQHRLLMHIWEQRRISSGDLLQKMKLKSEVALAGVISGLSKQLKALDIEPKQVFFIEVKWEGKKKTRTFMLNDFFVGAGAEHNWPDAWAQDVMTASPEEVEAEARQKGENE